MSKISVCVQWNGIVGGKHPTRADPAKEDVMDL